MPRRGLPIVDENEIGPKSRCQRKGGLSPSCKEWSVGSSLAATGNISSQAGGASAHFRTGSGAEG